LPAFWKEVDRILKPGGVFLAITYELNTFENEDALKVVIKVRYATLIIQNPFNFNLHNIIF